MAFDPYEKKSMVHMRSGNRNAMLLDAGPLQAAPPPTPLKTLAIVVQQQQQQEASKTPSSPSGRKSTSPGKAHPSSTSPRRQRGAAGAASSVPADPLAEPPPGTRGGPNHHDSSYPDHDPDRDSLEPGKIYISHKWSVVYQDWIQRILYLFDDAGLPYQQSDMSGDAYFDSVEFHIARCEYVVLLVTRDYAVALHSHQSRAHKEVKWAMKHRCRIVPVLHKDLVGCAPFYDPPGSHVAKSGSALSEQEKHLLAVGSRPLQQYVEKDLHSVFFTRLLSRLGRKSKLYDLQQVKELLELAGLSRCFEMLTLSKAYGGAGVQSVSELKKLFAEVQAEREPGSGHGSGAAAGGPPTSSAGIWSFKLQLSAAEEGKLRVVMGGWHSLACMPEWMRPGELCVALALANALDEQVIAKFGLLDMSQLGSVGLMGEGGGLCTARFVAEYAGLWERDAPRSNSPAPQQQQQPAAAAQQGAGGKPAAGPAPPASVHLTTVNLTGCSIGSRGGVALLDALVSGRVALQSLDLSRNGLDHASIPTLVKLLRSCVTLERLDVSGNPIGDLSGTSLVQCLSRYPGRLAHLDISRTGIGLQTLKALSQAVLKCQTLKALGLAGNQLSGRQLAVLAESMYTGRVEELDICDNPATIDFAQALAAAAVANAAAQHAAMTVGSAAAAAAATSSGGALGLLTPPAAASPSPLPPPTTQSSFAMSGSGFFGSGASGSGMWAPPPGSLPAAPGPTQLKLSDCNLGPEGMVEVAAALRHGAGLQGLLLARNAIGSEGAHALGMVLGTFGPTHLAGLATLELSGNYMGGQGVLTLASALRRLPALRVLSLEGCGLDGQELTALCEGVRVADRILDLLSRVISGIVDAQTSRVTAPINVAVGVGAGAGYSQPSEVVLGLQDAVMDMVAARGGGRWATDAMAAPQAPSSLKVIPDTPSMLLRWMQHHAPLRGLVAAGMEAVAAAKDGDRRGMARFQGALQELRGNGCRLRALNLGHTALPGEAGQALACLLAFSASLQDLQLRGCATDRASWRPWELWHKVIKGLQEALPMSPSLTALDVTGAGVTESSAAGLRRLLECCSCVRHLRLDRNRLGQPAMQILAPALTTQPQLCSMTLEHCLDEQAAMGAAVHVLGGNLRLQSVGLRGNYLDGAIGKALGLAISKHPNLTSLQLGGAMRYKLGDDGTQALGRAMRSSLRLTHVVLATCGVVDGGGVAALATALGANNRLREVDLSGNSLGPHGVQQLLSGLQQRTQRLARLALEGNCKVPAALSRAVLNCCLPQVAERKEAPSASSGAPPQDWGPYVPMTLTSGMPAAPILAGGPGGGALSALALTPRNTAASKSSSDLTALLSPRAGAVAAVAAGAGPEANGSSTARRLRLQHSSSARQLTGGAAQPGGSGGGSALLRQASVAAALDAVAAGASASGTSGTSSAPTTPRGQRAMSASAAAAAGARTPLGRSSLASPSRQQRGAASPRRGGGGGGGTDGGGCSTIEEGEDEAASSVLLRQQSGGLAVPARRRPLSAAAAAVPPLRLMALIDGAGGSSGGAGSSGGSSVPHSRQPSSSGPAPAHVHDPDGPSLPPHAQPQVPTPPSILSGSSSSRGRLEQAVAAVAAYDDLMPASPRASLRGQMLSSGSGRLDSLVMPHSPRAAVAATPALRAGDGGGGSRSSSRPRSALPAAASPRTTQPGAPVGAPPSPQRSRSQQSQAASQASGLASPRR